MFTGLTEQLDFGNHLIAEIVPEDHELVNLKKVLDWEKMNKIYRECYKSKKGNATKRTDLVLGIFILKHLYQKSYRTIIKDLHVNNAYMYFCSVSYEEIKKLKKEGKKLIDHSTLIKVKKRLGENRISRIENIFLQQLIDNGFIDGKYLFSDTTSLENNIIYPTEIGLLKRVIEEAEAVVQKVQYKKEMVKSEIIKKANQIAKVYYSSSKKTKDLLIKCGRELSEIANKVVKSAEDVVSRARGSVEPYVRKRFEKVKEVGCKIINQAERKFSGEKIKEKIVSYFEDHARALPKGKLNKPMEFGCKLRIDMSGNGYITNHELYLGNPSDVSMLDDVIREHKEVFDNKFRAAGLDRGFYDEQKILELEDEYSIDLAIPHKKDRSRKIGKRKERLYNKRSAIEAKISEGKRMCGLGKSLYRGFDGDKIWATFSVMALNIRKLIRELEKRPGLIKRFA
jgi:hypothetical protein